MNTNVNFYSEIVISWKIFWKNIDFLGLLC